MKKLCMRSIGVLACFVLVLSLVPAVSFAAEEKERIVVFETDFEAETVGANPTNSGFDTIVSTDVASFKVADDNGENKALKAWHGDPNNPDEKARGPRMDLKLSTKGLTNLRIEYDIKSSGGKTSFKLYFTGEGSGKNAGTIGAPYDFKEWTHITVDMDIKAQKATIYANGEKTGTSTLKFENEGTVIARFSALVELDGSWVMIDNISVSTTDTGYVRNQGISVDSIAGDVNPADAVAETGNIITILDVDYEDEVVGSFPQYKQDGGFTTGAISEVACLRVEEENGNKVVRAYHGDPVNYPETRSPRVERSIAKQGLTKLVIDYDVKSSLGETIMHVDFYPTSASKYLCRLRPPSAFKEWTHVKIRCDFETMKADIYTDGKLYATRSIAWGDETSFKVRISMPCAIDGSYLMLDNFKISTPDLDYGGAVSVSGDKINWDKLKIDPSIKTGMLDVMRMEHPRIFVTDWEAVRVKADSDEDYKHFKNNVIGTANSILKTDPTAYVRGGTDTINACSTTVKENAVTLAGAYQLTRDVRYKDRLWAELETAANWPDWGSDAFLCTAHLNLGFGVAYDWMYNDWTPEERKQVETWLMEMGLSQAVLSYEGFISAGWTRAASNWNNVCNGSNLIAALAIADTQPEVADYILAKAAQGIPYMYEELTADGGYCEPLGYWDYGIRHLVKTMAALDSALKPGATLPECLDFSEVVGLDNTGDFPIYYNGAQNGFNYGDGEDGIETTPILYYLATKFDKPQYAWYNTYMYKNNPMVSQYWGRNAMWSLLWYDKEHASSASSDFPLDKFYNSEVVGGAKALSMRSSFTDEDALIVMAIAGDMEAGHSHQNAGGYILDWAGKRWVHIYGRSVPGKAGTPYDWDNYFLAAWEGGRFDYYHTRGEANNTIIANPQQNRADMNINYVTKLDRYATSEGKGFGIMDLTDTNADYVSAKRGFMLTDNREVLIIQDEITAKKPSEYYWFTNTHADVTLAEDGKSALLTMDGDKMLVRITQGPADAKIGLMPTQPLPTSPDPDVQPDIEEHKLYIHIENQQNLKLTVEIVPLKEGEGISAPQPIVALENWTVEDAKALTTSKTLGDVVALKVDNPNAYAKGAKTYVDTANLEIAPIVQNGRTLVPVRFIAEKFGAKVGWNDATQTVTVESDASKLSLQIGSNQMMVDGNAITLDVPAQTIGGRTLIPLRALVEALGKEVFWDDRGLIIISDGAVNYSAEKITQIVDMLDIRVQADGKELAFFDSEKYDYTVAIAKGAAVPTITASATNGVSIVQGNPATVTVGDKTYTFRFVEDAFDGLKGTGSEGVVKYLNLYVDNGSVAAYQTYLDIVGATSSIEFDEKYPMNGTYDGIISFSVTQNRWSANGADHWICYDLGSVKNMHSVAIAGYKTDVRSYTLKLSVSADGENWTVVQPSVETLVGVDHTVFKLGDVQARYLRVDGLKATNTTWQGICEVRIYDSAQMEADDQASWNAYFYTTSIIGDAGQTLRLLINGESASGAIIPMDISQVKLTSINPEVATVDALGNVKLLKSGTTRIRAEANIDGVLKVTNITVDVQ